MTNSICRLCSKPIEALQPTEAYEYPDAGEHVHSACVGKLCAEVLALMRKLPLKYRILDPLEWTEVEGGEE